MRNHRSPRSTVPKNASLDNVNPADALESLHAEVVQLEAFAHLAAEVITRLPPPSNREQRREYRRLYALVNRVADDAIAAVNHGDALISALSGDLAARRAQRIDPPSARA
jgi:histidinol-phosphate/aromatic aminotransferase/cobyric acid decarboxylase-like protein